MATLVARQPFVKIAYYLKFPYHKGSNIYPQTANFNIESLEMYVCFEGATRPHPGCTGIMGKQNWGILCDPFVLVNIISLKTNLN